MQRPAILSLVVTVLFLAAGAGGFYALHDYFNGYHVEATSSLGKVVETTNQPKPDEPKELKTIIYESQKSVVQLEVTTSTGESVGSGFLYNDKGDIVTNAHVVKGATEIIAKTADAQQYEGYLIGMGETTDVAVVRFPELAGKMPLPLENKTPAEVGDEVIALGSPIGLQNTVTTGIISGVNRQFTIDNYTYLDVYQISAPIAKGNSGGPLIDQTTGKVLAINSAGTEEGSIGFSIPIRNVYEKIIEWSENPDEVPPEMMTDDDPSPSKEPSKLFPGDGEYIVGYFYESLSIGDYVTAYSLLGSKWQTSISYEKFREGYIHTVDVTIDKISSIRSKENEEATVTVFINALEREENQKTKSVLYKCTYQVGFENNQLKILSGQAEEVE
ncbi:S1C family serine protease [Alkalihalobacillus sp. AL-G]|uniref:S1C family serine protease n=1 Tax=Alkalihalobacillus sp. AL-G TaxID=2926399 RepID=UPI00272BF420|nr:trypsin-like peptidase domain-containing protein [Alkalihalobacillus sp. AL-G]WLD93242.1 S1C family serine protease [Alkalihalobacillus sp. AL-G]